MSDFYTYPGLTSIEALHIVASPVALRMRARKRFLTRGKSFDIRNRIYKSEWKETRYGAG